METPDVVGATVMRDLSLLGVALAFSHVTANGGMRMVFVAKEMLEVLVSRSGHCYLVTGYGAEPYSGYAAELAVQP